MTPVTCYLGLGANLDQPADQLRQALSALEQCRDIQLTGWSSFYRSKPVGPQDQPDYVNAVARIDTTLAPLALLDQLQAIEQQQGRVRLRRWGERTLDLDILLYADQCIDLPRLSVPHIEMCNRLFVIQPLVELAPDGRLPNGTALSSILETLTEQDQLVIMTTPSRADLLSPP
ncbi:2-amino-4-hydroxy-6-hydroxymethyldihydropteridine diphosphokinase [Oceanobacter sp. 4_MG-2023]|uniref:2-amino-4-hydroxy-6- hydroxymethyldihydropteridine diphosphokinase n=1 Tax=Oceanobacter sp. 4_MG-2023 TaxID=3062623 RepID=UPI0027345275|nr:2-amino-4-hydroxy-6-hydroxymethyldihydropteridine diphosphokinase [Oceanobacter sp. 4_MG-2023]MDP2549086.1 2-amino-4-hydroxy-6-hydroxymethyldihydropteridine diphosphokinase [Oceanobacter sp. 4_MG-2023]